MEKTPAANNPAFIYRGGDNLQHPPFEQQNSQMYGFFIKGQLDKLQACVDRDLNAAAAGQFNFQVLSESVMLTFTTIEKDFSLYPPDFAKGWGVEIDTCFWVPVGNIIEKDGKSYLDRVYWYTPYIWVNDPIAMAVGREVFGYPKTIGLFEIPDHSAPDNFKLTVRGHKEYNPDNEVEWLDLLSVKNLRPGDGPIDKWENFVDALEGIFDVAKGVQLFRPDCEVTEELIQDLLQPQIPQIFLKQFPNGDGKKAVYQALVESPAKVKKFHGGGLLEGEYQLNLQQIASAPIAQDLGLSLGEQPADFGFWLNFDFEVDVVEELVDNSQVAPEKIAILGGGISSVTAAFGLTSEPGWQNKYDITLYQLGWRIGGKGASGRNAQLGERIEEHGLHIWFGFYENAFDVIQQVYNELDRPADAPLSTWQEAFKPHNFVVNMEYIKDEWIPWYLNFPPKEGNPGEGEECLNLWNVAETMYAYLKQWIGDLTHEMETVKAGRMKTLEHPTLKQHLTALINRIEDEIEDAVEDAERIANGLLKLFKSMPKELEQQNREDHSWIEEILAELKDWLEDAASDLLEENTNLRRLFIGVDLGITILSGMHKDDIYNKGFDVINDLDFRDWLRKHGANEEFVVQSAPVRALYDLVFGYENGDANTPNLEAGTGLRGLLRIGLCYKGGVMWKMQAGMGDTMFTPFYEVLKQRGVKFKYFHEVDELTLDPNNLNSVDKITMTRQVDIIGGEDNYHPLVDVKGLGCWPSEPLYDQIVPEQAALLQEKKVDLESFWSTWPKVYQEAFNKPLPQITLEKGKDFDTIIFGISIESLPFLCPQLLEQSPALKASKDNIKTTVTQAYQLWTDKDLPGLGWTHFPPSGEEPVLGSWTEPVDTWAAMNQLLIREDWSELGLDPKNVAYFCGVQPVTEIPPRDDYGFPARSRDKVREATINQLNHDIHTLWPDAATDEQFRWEVLIDPEQQQGEARLDAQYYRSNVSPTERYVLSVVNSTKHRIATDGAGFDNVYFTGDWIKNNLNAGCVEGATMSGLQTSRAICGWPKIIHGEKDF